MENNQKIKCNVKSCEYNKSDCNECNLEEIWYHVIVDVKMIK